MRVIISRSLGKTRIGFGDVKLIPFHFSLKPFSSCRASGPSPGVHGPAYPGALIQVLLFQEIWCTLIKRVGILVGFCFTSLSSG